MAIARKALLLALLGISILVQSGCATSEEDLGYTRQKPSDPPPKNNDLSHGWGNE